MPSPSVSILFESVPNCCSCASKSPSPSESSGVITQTNAMSDASSADPTTPSGKSCTHTVSQADVNATLSMSQAKPALYTPFAPGQTVPISSTPSTSPFSPPLRYTTLPPFGNGPSPALKTAAVTDLRVALSFRTATHLNETSDAPAFQI